MLLKKKGRFEQIDEEGFAKEISEDHLSSFLEKGQNVFVAGCFDSACISNTVEGALENEFKVYVDRDMNILQDRRDNIKGKVTFEFREKFSDEGWSEIESIYNEFEERLHILKKTKQKAPLCK